MKLFYATIRSDGATGLGPETERTVRVLAASFQDAHDHTLESLVNEGQRLVNLAEDADRSTISLSTRLRSAIQRRDQ